MSSTEALRPAHFGDDQEEFLRVLRLDMTQLPDRLIRKSLNHGMGDFLDGPQARALADDLAQELYVMLRKYLAFLEGFGHGGWSRNEEREIERIVGLLDRAGWTIHPDSHGELDGGLNGSALAAAPDPHHPADDGENRFLWDHASSPDR